MKSLFNLTFLSLIALAAAGTNLHERALGPRQSLHSRLASQLNPVKRDKCRPKHGSTPAPSSKPVSSPAPKDDEPAKGGGGSGSGLIKVGSDACGANGATSKVTKTTGPNGSIDWLNCGIEGGGWKPPNVQIDDLVTMDLGEALKDPKSPFKACSKYLSLMEKAADKHGLPAIVIASIAMQESSCNPGTVGGGGEQGLMQITKDKCGGAPGGNCRDPAYNIDTGAKFLRSQLNDFDGNIIAAVGTYNGWSLGLTKAKATKAAHSSCCTCQNNLDYIFQFVNGWLQNINAYDSKLRLGKFFNLDVCH